MRKTFAAVIAVVAVIVQAIQLPTAEAANSYLTNPLGFAYKSVTGVADYGKPTGMVITGRCNRYDPAFAAAS